MEEIHVTLFSYTIEHLQVPTCTARFSSYRLRELLMRYYFEFIIFLNFMWFSGNLLCNECKILENCSILE